MSRKTNLFDKICLFPAPARPFSLFYATVRVLRYLTTEGMCVCRSMNETENSTYNSRSHNFSVMICVFAILLQPFIYKYIYIVCMLFFYYCSQLGMHAHTHNRSSLLKSIKLVGTIYRYASTNHRCHPDYFGIYLFFLSLVGVGMLLFMFMLYTSKEEYWKSLCRDWERSHTPTHPPTQAHRYIQ